mgnify:CR=1 FL=1
MSWLDYDDSADRLLGRTLRRQAERRPDAPFLLAGDDVWSYGRANEIANAYAAGFAARGVGRGDTVAFLLDSCPEYVFMALALNKLGAIWVPNNVDYKGIWLEEALQDSRARLLVSDAERLEKVCLLYTSDAADENSSV